MGGSGEAVEAKAGAQAAEASGVRTQADHLASAWRARHTTWLACQVHRHTSVD
jgi:hypothetical protein